MSVTSRIYFTPIQQRMIDIFSDGGWHTLMELHTTLYELDAPLSNVRKHLTMLRQKLMPNSQDIISERRDGVMKYRHVKILSILHAEPV